MFVGCVKSEMNVRIVRIEKRLKSQRTIGSEVGEVAGVGHCVEG